MQRYHRSRYLRSGPENHLLRLFVARAFLCCDVERLVRFDELNARTLRTFPAEGYDKALLEDVGRVREWLERTVAECPENDFDAADVFSRNTAGIAAMVGLDEAELRVLRFALLFASAKTLDTIADECNAQMNEMESIDFVARVAGMDNDAVAGALSRRGRLRRSGLLTATRMSAADLASWLKTPHALTGVVFEPHPDPARLATSLFEPVVPSALGTEDFAHLAERVELLRRYLAGAVAARTPGVNVLLWGPPGTGKTELGRYLVEHAGADGFEVTTVDVDGDPIDTRERFHSYRLGQAMLEQRPRSILLFDEVEDVISDAGFETQGFRGASPLTKGLLNRTLESNPVPAIWITNTTLGVDTAFLRRFDLVLKLDNPDDEAKRRIAERTLDGIDVEARTLERMMAREAIGPAHLDKLRRVVERLELRSADEIDPVAHAVMDGDLEAVHELPLTLPKDGGRRPGHALPYDATLLNADSDLERIAGGVTPDASLRLCLYGPPGTGKTAWARHLAERTGRPITVTHQHEIRDCYVGETEKRLARAFREAERQGAVLVFDEVDSFLQDRGGAHQHHEVQAVNQFLTCLETYEGLLVCSTNLLDGLDPATLRRFDFKVRFDYLTPEQAARLPAMIADSLGMTPFGAAERAAARRALAGAALTPGDAEVLRRRYRALGETPDVARMIEDLRGEARFRTRGAGRMGFLVAGG